MPVLFDESKWLEIIEQPDWYVQLYPELKRLQKADESKKAVRDFFESVLQKRKIALASSGPNLDKQRQPIDTIVIHHTSAEPAYRLSRMNAVQMLNVYVPYFIDPTDRHEKGLKGQPLWSNHVRDSQPVFYLYHWLVRMNGSFERLLEDNELGWHAANWGVNCRSVAICLDNDYEKQDPEPALLKQLAGFISKNYPQVSVNRIFGHSEVSSHKTICPGGNFVHGWKQDLLKLVAAA